MARWMGLMMLVALIAPMAAQADERTVLARLPAERRAEMMAALRIELAGRATLVEGTPAGDASEAVLRAQAASTGATHVVWVVFPDGLLAPAEVRVLDLARSAAAHATTPQAWDVVNPRVVGVLTASLVDRAPLSGTSRAVTTTAASEPTPEVAETAAEAAAVAEAPAAEVTAPASATPSAEPAPPAPVTLREPELGDARRARTFSLWAGVGIAHDYQPGIGGGVGLANQIGFYARISEWASIGLRLSGAFGYTSVEGALIRVNAAVPSFACSFREALGTAAVLELGVHVDGGVHLDWIENRAAGEDQLSFGLGVGAFGILELGRAHGIQLDYTFNVYGLGGLEAETRGTAILSYVRRWD